METKKIFLSPSNQTANIGAYQNTNEHEQCQLIAESAKAYLDKEYNCLTYIAEKSNNMKSRAEYANAIDCDLYLAIHTNAFSDITVEGTETYYYSSDKKGQEFAVALLDAVSGVTKAKRRAKPNDSLIELNTPTCTRAYIEVDFHTNPEKAKFITENTELLGRTIAECIANFLKLTKPSEPQTPPDTEDKKTETADRDEQWINENIDFILDAIAKCVKKDNLTEKYYRVQSGAFSSKENAEKLAKKLKEAGFDAIIKYD